jgi:hypothetical protein
LGSARNYGLVGLINFNEKSPIPWKGVIFVGGLGILQAVAGGLIVGFTAGGATQIGLSLIA